MLPSRNRAGTHSGSHFRRSPAVVNSPNKPARIYCFVAQPDQKINPSEPIAVQALGWVADEAVASPILRFGCTQFDEAVVLAMNHSGDSDSTGAITGNICGALNGVAAIPGRWLEPLELSAEITAIADDLAAAREDSLDMESDLLPSAIRVGSTLAASSALRRVPRPLAQIGSDF